VKFNQAVCSGCRACELTCTHSKFKENNPKKAAIRIKSSQTPGHFEAQYCNQCGDCIKACPTEAIYEEDGVYKINNHLCTGCYACIEACKEGLIFIAVQGDPPVKCDYCGECAKECPPNALG